MSISDQNEKTNCTACHAKILLSTFERYKGKCARCAKLTPDDIARKKLSGMGITILGVLGYLFLWIVPGLSVYALILVLKDPWVVMYQPGVLVLIPMGIFSGFRLLKR